jgi:hypothetical protein
MELRSIQNQVLEATAHPTYECSEWSNGASLDPKSGAGGNTPARGVDPPLRKARAGRPGPPKP